MSQKIDEIIVRAEAGQAAVDDGYYLLNIMQEECDRLHDMIEDLPPVDMNVTMVIDGNSYVISLDEMQNWIAEEFNNGSAANLQN